MKQVGQLSSWQKWTRNCSLVRKGGRYPNNAVGVSSSRTSRSSTGILTGQPVGKMDTIHRRRDFSLLLAIVLMFSCGIHSNAQGTVGEFISIDCGSPSNYTDSLGIFWSTDMNYISTGENAVVRTATANLGSDLSQNKQKLTTIRYFPGVRKKHCYVIPEALETTVYLIRLMFLGGDFTSSQNQNVSFGVTINNFYWSHITISDSFSPLIKEVTYTTGAGPMSICLVRGVGTPFVSSLELRSLPSYYYQGTAYPGGAFTTVFRWNCGTLPTDPSLRYPDDVYDRLWAADDPSFQFDRFSNSSAPLYNVSSESNFGPPTKVMQSGWTAPLASTLEILWPVPAGASSIFAILSFAEIASVPKKGTRKLEAYIDNKPFQTDPIEVTSSVYETLNFTYTYNESSFNITISPLAGSTLGAILNGLEVYSFQFFDASYATWQPDVAALAAIKRNFNLTDWTGDPCLPVPWDWVQCSSPNETTISRILQINLSNYNRSGTIPTDIISLTELQDLLLDHNNLNGDISNLDFPAKLQTVQLQNNQLEGSIPNSLADLPNLSLLNLDNNRLTGNVPQSLLTRIEENSLRFSASGNPFLCFGGNVNCTGQSPPSQNNGTYSGKTSHKSTSSVGIVAGAVGGAVIAVLLLLAGALFYYRKRRSAMPKVDHTSDPPGPSIEPSNKDYSHQGRYFSLVQVKAATNNLAKVIGKGGFGLVYYGKLPDGQEVAVKVNKGNTANGQGTEEFLNEVSLLSRVHHRNLVSLVGYCDEQDQQILIYAYMSEGTLREHLYGESQIGVQLDWKTRLDIALNSARGLEYLHNSCFPPIIHRDVKSSNILLTHTLLAKVADFGISKITTDDDRTRGITTMIKGTHGYFDPEYFMEQRLTTKSDVYSFGIVLLELVTGRKPNTMSFPGSTAICLRDWVRDSVREGNIHAIIDPQLGGSYNLESMWKVVEMALLSLDQQGVKRPDMQEIVRGLTNAFELQSQYIQTPITGHSPAQLSANEFDSYQRVHHANRDSNDSSVATYSWGSNGNMSGR